MKTIEHFSFVIEGTEILIYDNRFKEGFTPRGQFIARYTVQTLLNNRKTLEEKGLCLASETKDWEIWGNEMKELFLYIDAVRNEKV